MKGKKNWILLFIFIAIISSFFYPIHLKNLKNSVLEEESQKSPESSIQVFETKTWFKNPTFESPVEQTWFWTNGTEGDNSDVEAITSSGLAGFNIIGENRTFEIVSGTPNNTITSPGWEQFNNSIYYLPDKAELNASGCYVYHRWEDDSNQFPSVHWRKNVSIPIDMSDYKITSATLNVTFSAIVDDNVDTPNDGAFWDNYAIGDSVTFYCQISDLGYNSPVYTIAHNKTKFLGQNSPNVTHYFNRPLATVNEIDLITALESVFEKDPDHSNFTLTLGIDIYCEDNIAPGPDDDIFESIIIKSCNFTFSCTKRVDHSTTISWNQIGNQISSQNVQVTDAKFNFKYKINTSWPIFAPLSEMRFFINNKIYNEKTIKLTDLNTTFQNLESNGLDVLGYIKPDINISISIQIYIKDSFVSDKAFNISIDDVFLNISYIKTLPDYETNIQLFFNNVEKTSEPFIELPIGDMLNISVKYTNTTTGMHISGAKVLLRGDRILQNLTEDSALEQYSLSINSSSELNLGENPLTIEAAVIDHQTKILTPRVIVRKIKTEINTLSGTNIINIKPGNDITLEIIVNNTDYAEIIKNAVVTYSWQLGQGELIDTNNDGIYEVTIENVPAGTYSITITAFSGDDYTFETQEIELVASRPVNPIWNILLYVLIIGIVGLVSIFTLYQTRLKYPPIVRKIRKLRKKVKKGRKMKSLILNNRIGIINSVLSKNLELLRFESIELEGNIIPKMQNLSNKGNQIEKRT